MAIGQSKLHELLRRGRLLSDAVAWLDAFGPELRRTILVDWIQKDQLTRQGVDADGAVLGYYSYVTEIVSRGRKRQGEHYTLEDTGDFYKSMYVTVLRNAIEIDGDVDKFKDQDWYSSKILGLTDENFKKLIDEVRLAFQNYARRILLVD